MKLRGLTGEALVLVFGLLAAGMAVADATDLQMTTNNVPEGQTVTVSGRISAADGTRTVKTGGGKLVLPMAAVDQKQTYRLQVQEGSVELKSGGTTPAAVELLDSVKAKLAVWLSAQSTDTLKPNTSAIENWYDVRETDFTSPKYIYAKTSHFTSDESPTLQTGQYIHQGITVTNEMTGVYFRGMGSGVSMDFMLPNGNHYAVAPYEVTAVHGVIDTWGYLFGNSHTDNNNPYLESDTGGRTADISNWSALGYGWMHCWFAVMGDSRIWLDGIEIDRATTVQKGFHLLHRRRNSINNSESTKWLALYSWGTYTNGTASSLASQKRRRGGDYISEIMYFSNNAP